MTGRFRACAPGGVKTFRYRQSSDVLATPNGDAGCAQCGAKLVAWRTPRQDAAGCGGCQRSAPTGGAAYGMPRYSSVPPAVAPCTAPPAVGTIRPRPWPVLWLWGLRGACALAVATAHAVVAIATAAAAAPTPSRVRPRPLVRKLRIRPASAAGVRRSNRKSPGGRRKIPPPCADRTKSGHAAPARDDGQPGSVSVKFLSNELALTFEILGFVRNAPVRLTAGTDALSRCVTFRMSRRNHGG